MSSAVRSSRSRSRSTSSAYRAAPSSSSSSSSSSLSSSSNSRAKARFGRNITNNSSTVAGDAVVGSAVLDKSLDSAIDRICKRDFEGNRSTNVLGCLIVGFRLTAVNEFGRMYRLTIVRCCCCCCLCLCQARSMTTVASNTMLVVRDRLFLFIVRLRRKLQRTLALKGMLFFAVNTHTDCALLSRRYFFCFYLCSPRPRQFVTTV